jgi:hypothetical protein
VSDCGFVWKWVAIALTLACPLSVSAGQMTLFFDGTISDMNTGSGSDPNLAIGTYFWGSLTFHDEAPLISYIPEAEGVGARGEHPEYSTYDLSAVPSAASIHLGDYVLTTPTQFEATLIDNQIFHQGFASAADFSFGATGPYPTSGVQLDLIGGSDGEPLAGTGLVRQLWDLDDFPNSMIQFGFADADGFGGFTLSGTLDHLGSMPEPEIAWLLAPLAACALGYRRARS